jgi:CheY-specific phosphatase CheX
MSHPTDEPAITARTTTLHLFSRAIRESVVQLYAGYGLALEPIPEGAAATAARREFLCGGIIGFTGAGIQGTLLVAMTSGALDASQPAGSTSRRGWIGEVANHLLGLVKRRLLLRGVELHGTTPLVIQGQSLAPVPRGELRAAVFSSPRGIVTAWIDLELDASFVIGAAPEDGAFALPEGGAILF